MSMWLPVFFLFFLVIMSLPEWLWCMIDASRVPMILVTFLCGDRSIISSS